MNGMMGIKIKTDYNKSAGFVYNKAYYVLKAIFRSEKFSRYLNSLLKRLDRIEFIIPDKRSKRFFQSYKVNELVNEVREKGINLVDEASSILSKFGIESDDFKVGDDYYNYLEGILNKIFFNQSREYNAYQFPNYKYDNEEKPTELWIQIHPWTTKKVYDSYFPFITMLKGKLLNSIHKIKPWETFERDLELYKLYLKVRKDIKNGILNKKAITGTRSKISKSPTVQMLYYPEYNEIKKRFPIPEFDDENVARLISDTQKKLDNIQLL